MEMVKPVVFLGCLPIQHWRNISGLPGDNTFANTSIYDRRSDDVSISIDRRAGNLEILTAK